MNAKMSEKEFYLRNFTWGLPVNLGGALISLGLLATGHRPKRYGSCINFEVGNNWGGGSLGVFMFTGKNVPERLKAHELGHGIQNAYFGPLMPFAVNIPSSARFWSRKLTGKLMPKKMLSPYDSVWFEAQASQLGEQYMRQNYPSSLSEANKKIGAVMRENT